MITRLVWAVIPLVLVISIIGIVGMQEVFGIEMEELDDYSSVVSLCDIHNEDNESRLQLLKSAKTDDEKQIVNTLLNRCLFVEGWNWSEKHWKWLFEGDGWHSFLNNATEEYIQQNLVNETIIKESIKIIPTVGGRDSLPPPMRVYILFDVIENGSTIPFVSLFWVSGTGSLNKEYESEFLAPKKMWKKGITSFHILCKEGLERIYKVSDGSPVCVKPTTAEKLLQRGWTLNQSYTQQNIDTVYIPSDITNANPNFVIENAEIFWSTHNIEDVKDDVVFTLQGTVLSIDDPIDWNVGGPVSTITNRQQIMGFIPITISLDKVYKGNLTDDTFTFYVTSNKYDGKYHVSPDAANFETGEKVLVHLAHSDLGSFPDGHYYPKLSQFGKYQINENDIAFNIHHPNGIPLDVVSGEALP